MTPATHRFTRIQTLALALALLAPLLSQGATPSTPDPAIERAVLEVNAEMIAAADKLDLDTFFGAITESAQIVQNGTIFPNRAEARAGVERGLRGVTRMERRLHNPTVTVIAADTALLVSEGDATFTVQDGRVMTSRFAVSLVFTLQDGRWQVMHGHYSTLPGPM